MASIPRTFLPSNAVVFALVALCAALSLTLTAAGTRTQVASLAINGLEGYPEGETVVRRRFRDFVALADRLAISQRGYFLPLRPEKKIEGQMDASQELMDERREQLDAWLKQCASAHARADSHCRLHRVAARELRNRVTHTQLRRSFPSPAGLRRTRPSACARSSAASSPPLARSRTTPPGRHDELAAPLLTPRLLRTSASVPHPIRSTHNPNRSIPILRDRCSPSLLSQSLLAQTSGSLLEGAARLPKQLLGTESAVPAPEEVSVPASGSNILRVLKELGQSVAQAAPTKGDGKGPAEVDEKFLAEKAKHQARARVGMDHVLLRPAPSRSLGQFRGFLNSCRRCRTATCWRVQHTSALPDTTVAPVGSPLKHRCSRRLSCRRR